MTARPFARRRTAMTTTETEGRDHSALKEIGAFLIDMGDQFNQHALTYAVAMYLYETENARKPPLPPMHSMMAKAITEVVKDVVYMDRHRRGRAA
jgi:hypothetical protein